MRNAIESPKMHNGDLSPLSMTGLAPKVNQLFRLVDTMKSAEYICCNPAHRTTDGQTVTVMIA